MSRGEIYRLERERRVSQLCHALESERDRRVRESAVLALGRLGDPAALPALAAAGMREEHPSVRLALLETLRSFHDRSAVPVFLRLLDDDKRNTRLRAIRALGEIGDSRAVRPLILLLEDHDPSVRGAAAHALSKIGDPAAIAPLSDAIAKTRRPWLRARLKMARTLLSDRAS